tara:strand:- start:847 stop:1854 length:1008 start_codon:yes stop_codon:yes gene_type:complete
MIDEIPLGVGIIGCGLIGNKRANSLGSNGRLLFCFDIDKDRSKLMAEKFNSKVTENWQELIRNESIDLVIVSTLHDSLAEITLAAAEYGKHVLVEKPAARNFEEIKFVLNKIKNQDVKVRVGFNHRYHRALQKAKELVDSGALGELMFIRSRYGHGGRKGYNNEWRSKPELSGGGELIDQGSHLIDLSRWFLGDFSNITGYANTYYWDMPVDDNAFLILKNTENQVAFLQVSCTEWKNMFSMEIYGKLGKLDISGLGGSYGLEKITFYKMLPEMGPPETCSWEYPMSDNSWSIEIQEFFNDIKRNRVPSPNLTDAYQSLKIIQKIYSESGYDFSS